MSSTAGETPAGKLLDRMVQHCHKLSGAAKKETLELEELCTTLKRRLKDSTSEQSNYDDLNSALVEVEGQLALWSNYGYMERWMKKGTIKAGIRACIESLKPFTHEGLAAPPTPKVKTSDSRDVEDTLPLGGADNTSAVNVTSRSNRESLAHQTAEHDTPENHSVEATQPPPPVKRLDGKITKNKTIPFAEGMYCEVWEGQWDTRGAEESSGDEIGGKKADVKKVALKVIRILKPPERAERARKALERELPSWAALHHQNILPFYGIADIDTRLHMVFPWCENGNLLDYVKKHPKEDKHRLLRGSAAGLNYLHLRNIVHGNIRCNNVLISHEGEPQICDFGVAKIIHETHENSVSKTVSSASIIRYAAPELIEHNNFSITTHADTYSFALLILECITEVPPFSNISRDAAVIHARISKKQTPPRPEKNLVSDELWDLMNRCWSIVPDQRPTMEVVHRFFLDLA